MRKKALAPDLHISIAGLRKMSPADLLAIDGPKFIMREVVRGNETLAVLISHDKWRTLNHRSPDVDPHKIQEFFVGGQMYLNIPVECADTQLNRYWVSSSEKLEILTRAGIEIRPRKKPRKKVKL